MQLERFCGLQLCGYKPELSGESAKDTKNMELITLESQQSVDCCVTNPLLLKALAIFTNQYVEIYGDVRNLFYYQEKGV